ncbi:hypothetical protein D3C76_1753130 [compost metagenome]
MEELANRRGRTAPVAAQCYHVRRTQGVLHLIAEQHVVFVRFTGHAPVGGDIHKYPLILSKGSGNGLFAERLPGNAILH